MAAPDPVVEASHRWRVRLPLGCEADSVSSSPEDAPV